MLTMRSRMPGGLRGLQFLVSSFISLPLCHHIASVTHSFIAHQLPDIAGAVLVPLIGIVMIFAVDWRMGLVCLVPVAGALMLMGFSMGEKGRHFMASYMDSLEEMNSEAVEYVRGIPVVKTFGQTIYSFRLFKDSIDRYIYCFNLYGTTDEILARVK